MLRFNLHSHTEFRIVGRSANLLPQSPSIVSRPCECGILLCQSARCPPPKHGGALLSERRPKPVLP